MFIEKCKDTLKEIFQYNLQSYSLDSFDLSIFLFTNVNDAYPEYIDICERESNKKGIIELNDTYKNVLENYNGEIFYIRRSRVITPDFGISDNGDVFVKSQEDYNKFIAPYIKFREERKTIGYVAYSGNSISTYNMDVKDLNYDGQDFFDNYNDDLPFDKLVNFCNSQESGIIILHGNPGCGSLKNFVSPELFWI